MKKETLICMLVLVLFAAQHIYPGTTGKLAGKITDKETGEPLPYVNVIIEGTTMGASSDEKGYYVILNIPPGNYSIKVQYVGYQSIVFENVTISVDFTTTRNFEMSSQAVEIGTLIVTAEKPLVTKDMTSSLSTVTAEQIRNLPVQNVQDVLRLNAGVIEENGRLSIRGGRTSEVAYWVNGISTTDVYNGTTGMTVENAAVQELQVISGTFNAEYGQAMSGIVNIITKQGGKEYNGQIRVYGGDYLSNADEFSLYKSLKSEADPNTGLTKIIESEKDYPLNKINPIYNAEFSLSGPVPFTDNSFTFFATGRYFHDEGYYYGRSWYRPIGAPGSNDLVAMNPYDRYSAQGKLNYQLSNSLRLSYDLFWSKDERERNYFGTGNSHDFKYNPYGLPQNYGTAVTHLFTINHVLTPSSFYEIRVSRFNSESEQYVYKNPLQAAAYISQTDSLNNVTWSPDPNGPDGYIEPNSGGGFDLPESYSFLNHGMDMNNSFRSTKYWIGKLDYTNQINNSNQIKVGAEARLYELELHNFRIIPARDPDNPNQNKVPFEPAVPTLDNINRNDYLRKPREFSAYIQDKLEFQNIILNVGLRWDYFDANASLPADPTDPNIYLPLRPENKFDVNGDGKIDQNDNQADPSAVAKRRSYWYKKVDPKTSLSPRLGIAFPITDRGVIHFSYGHFFQIPEFQYLYTNPDFKISESSNNVLFGNPSLDPQRTVMYEIGLQQQLWEDIGIDVTLFYRDVRDWVGTSPLIKTYKADVQYSMYENKDYENVKGVTFQIEKRFSNSYSFRADYTFQSAEGTYSNPNDAFNAISNNQAPVLSLQPMNWDQKHTVNAQIIYQTSNWTFSLIGRYWSGQPYTPSFPVGEIATEVSGLARNSARLPAQRSVDLTINKLFNLFSGTRFEVFMNVYNLFDIRDETSVYSDTGTADYTTSIDPSKIPYKQDRVSTVEDYVLQPSWYTSPRQVQLGVLFGF